MKQVGRITAEAREDILVQALLTCPNLTEVSKKTKIPRPTIYTVINTDSFRKKYTEARDKAVTTAIAYLQGKLGECAAVLVDTATDPEVPAQIRVNATNEFNTEYEKLLNNTHAKANEIRMELMKQTEDFYTINPDRVEPGTMDLLISGVLNEHDINVLAERNRDNTTMLRMILRTAEKLDSGLAYKIKNIGTGENEMNILNDLATWGERCIIEDRITANINRQHYDRIYESLCENMENLYAKPSL